MPPRGHQVRRRLGCPRHDHGQVHHLLAERQTVPRAGTEVEEVIDDPHRPPGLVGRHGKGTPCGRVALPRVHLQGEEDGGEWVAQLVGQGRQRLACWQRHQRWHRGIT